MSYNPRLLWTVLFLTLGVAPASAQLGSTSSEPPAYDERVQRALDAEGWKYEIDGDDDFRMVVGFSDEERSQLVYVRSTTATAGNFDVREIWSPVYNQADNADQVPSDVARWALRRSWDMVVGSLAMDNSGTIYFVAKIAADVSAEDLSSTIRLAASVADELEKEQSTADDL